MLDQTGFKEWIHRDLNRLDKLLLTLATFDQPIDLNGIRGRAAEAGWRFPKAWNLSSILGRSNGLAIRVPLGWELTESGKSYLRNLGLTTLSPSAVKVASDLRTHLERIQNPTTRAFAEEAIKCHEAQLYRSAVVMSWIAAVDVLHREVVAHHLAAFNAEAKKVNSKWKDAVNEDGIGLMKEEDFLNRIAGISVIGKNQKDELLKGLKLRNGCGHPNSLQVGPNMVASHLETLLLNVFEKFET
ncbi:hypothetical protein [Mesorhizobium muleiense]|uniref:Uncharacterized protein n=1 Tax=Mesorhizobium muleiense TaxID=1004279 RepID=A0A1G8X5S8_9HYPH|nr:hypothetical protein [Mesorhizobium muleiense]MCF6097992.1 hypothetical protein [Mesorhizobium muleiense]SDJ85686.1 hypothetical protein SAMN05428953_109173 [Mesorhizobium muleiense]